MLGITLAHVWFVLAMFGAAVNAKALGLSVVFAGALVYAGLDETATEFLAFFYVPAYLLASFRD